jgi:hypothetical protein
MKIVGLVGILIVFELFGGIICSVAVIYLSNQLVAAMIGSLSCITLTIVLIAILLKAN